MAPNNSLPIWGNDKTMNLNTLVLTNIQSSPYFKVQLFELKTFHEVVDEIYYRVEHLEPWEKGSRKTSGQTGMCGGVRGVGAGGIVSSAYCLLFKLFTLKLTKKQVNNLISHSDSPYIRGLGFMYIRYTQPPQDLWDWYEPFLDDEEEVDVKAGGGHTMTIGEMLRQWLVKLEWYSTLFPRIPVPIQKDIDLKLRSRTTTSSYQGYSKHKVEEQEPEHIPDDQVSFGEAERAVLSQRGRSGISGSYARNDYHSSGSHQISAKKYSPHRSPPRQSHSRSHDYSRELERERERQRSRYDKYRSDSQDRRKSRSRSRDRRRSRSRSHSKTNHRSNSSERKEHSSHHYDKEHQKKKKNHKHKEKNRERRHH